MPPSRPIQLPMASVNPQESARPPALPRAEELFRSAVDDAPIGVAITDHSGRFLLVNPSFCRLLGRPAGELLRTRWQDVTHPDDRHAQEAFERNALAGRARFYQAEKRYLRPDGSSVWATISQSMVGKRGRARYFISQVQDVSERRRAEELLLRRGEELTALYETTLGLISRLEPTSLLQAILSRAAALVGAVHAYLYVLDEGADQLIVRAGIGVFAEHIGMRLGRGEGLGGRVWESGKPLAIDDYSRWSGRVSGFDFVRTAVGIPLRTGDDFIGVLGLVRLEEGRPFDADDLTLLSRFGHMASLALENARLYEAAQVELAERRRAEKELERSAAELRQANEDLRHADELKSHFVAVASHELRTPLTSILGFASTLLIHWDSLPDEERRAQVGIIDEQGERLAQLVDDLLMMSKIDAGVLETQTEPVDLRSAAEGAVAAFPGYSDVLVDVAAGRRATADPRRLQQILVNLVSNALKYGAPPIRVEARPVPAGVEVAVVDHGPGIPEDFHDRLFDKFAQAPAARLHQAGGTGLGLSIVRGLAEAQRGAAWFEPNEPQGARFLVRLPGA